MAYKPSTGDHNGPYKSPPCICMSDKLLSSAIILPNNPCILYATFMPESGVPQGVEFVELARRQIIAQWSSSAILDSLLCNVYIAKDVHTLYVFVISPGSDIDECRSRLKLLSFEALSGSQILSFTPIGAYPCSADCAEQNNLCSKCRDNSSTSTNSPSSAACVLPRKQLRHVYWNFLEAVRNRIIEDISQVSKKSPHGRPVKRYKQGFVLGPTRSSSEWGFGWEHHTQSRCLVQCSLDVHLSPSRILLHPILQPTDFIPLSNMLPLRPGAPVVLLPYGTPAYFLTLYTGPIGVLTAEFEQSLAGLGVGDWSSSPPPSQYPYNASSKMPEHAYSMYVIIWISVQNKQGEDKGIRAIWPTRLILSYTPSSTCSHAQKPLVYIPELPSQLQPSPPRPGSTVSAPPPCNVPSSTSQTPSTSQAVPLSPYRKFRRSCMSPASHTLRAFRSLTLAKTRDIHKIALDAGSYVDAIAKERERERERLRKEREAGPASVSPRTAPTPNVLGQPAALGQLVAGSSTAPPTPAPSHNTPGAMQGEQEQIVNVSPDISAAPLLATSPVSSPPAADDATSPLFYPSPPQTTPASAMNLYAPDRGPTEQATDATESAESSTNPVVPATAETFQQSFDPFGNLDSSWSNTGNEFMSMNIDYGSNFSMNMDAISRESNGNNGSRMNMDFDDDFAFTDDDFSFFDNPSKLTVPPAFSQTALPMKSEESRLETSSALGLPIVLVNDKSRSLVSGPSEPSPVTYQASPWLTGAIGDVFSPAVYTAETIPPVPELVPMSPARTTSTFSAPATPTVQLCQDVPKSSLVADMRVCIFDPIPFAPSHRQADSKYIRGKFALPSPPDEEDRTEPILHSDSTSRADNWKIKYNAVTDPRVTTIRKLIGVKRKSRDQVSSPPKRPCSWVSEYEGWSSTPAGSADDGESEAESEEEEEEDGEEEQLSLPSRPSTPLPTYVPKGHSLLHSHFHHALLLALSTPLRPPDAGLEPIDIGNTVPVSVPTPVSPAAGLGAAADKAKILEAAAYTIAKEVVENCIWAEAWQACLTSSSPVLTAETWDYDAKHVSQLLADVPGLLVSLDLENIFYSAESASSTADKQASNTTLEMLSPPMITVAKGDAVVTVSPTAMRFWEKLGLSPRAGKKDVTAFVLFEEGGPDAQAQVGNWLTAVSEIYNSKHLGEHTAGNCGTCQIDGLVPLRFDSFRKTFPNFVSSLPTPHGSLVFYIVVPVQSMTLTSPVLRQVYSSIKRAMKTYCEIRVVFQLVPDYIVFGSVQNPGTRSSDLELLCLSVYSRILQPVDRQISRNFFEDSPRIRNYFQGPGFTLARPASAKVAYAYNTSPRSLDVVDRHMLLHVGYAITSSGKWVIAACVDQRGEGYDLGVWLTASESVESSIVAQVWDFASQFARKANMEWRIAICKFGTMDINERDAWITFLDKRVPSSWQVPMFQVSLLSVVADSQWLFLESHDAPKPSPTKTKPSQKEHSGTFFADASATFYAMYPSVCLPVFKRDTASLSFIPDVEDVSSSEDIGISPISTTLLIRAPADRGSTSVSMLQIHLLRTIKSPYSSLTIPDADTHRDITRNFYELAVLAEVRLIRANPLLPFHLAALEVMQSAMIPCDLIDSC